MSSISNHAAEHAEMVECAICGEVAGIRSTQAQEFAYRDGQHEVILSACMPVIRCDACEEIYTAEGAEEAQHEAVCRHLGRLTPAELRALRARLGISQAKLADLTHIGIASIKRWERGTHIQNASLDAKLRALDDGEPGELPIRSGYRFQFPPRNEDREASRRWQLRPDYSAMHALRKLEAA